MKRLIKRNKGELITALIILVLEVIFFSTILLSPNSYLFRDGLPDSTQNYYTTSYASAYDYGFHFTGMNYPFGDQVLFADAQFPLTTIIHFINIFLFNGVNHSVAILNLFLFLSYILCAVFIYKILREFGVGEYFSILPAVFITALSPQVQCFSVHYSLVYLHVFPAAWYLIIKISNSSKPLKWTAFLFLHSLFFGLIHLYYLAIIFVFALISALFYIILNRKDIRIKLLRQLIIIGSLIFAGFCILFFLHITNSVNDRVKEPWGFFTQQTSLATVFYPQFLNSFSSFHIIHSNWVNYAYVGLACDILLFLSLFFLIKRLYKKWISKQHFSSLISLSPYLLAAVIILVFSARFPYSLYNFFYRHITFLCQFRILKRFALVFYYVSGIYCAYFLYLLYRLLNYKKRKRIAMLFTSVVLLIWAGDGFVNNITMAHQIRNTDIDFYSFKNNDTKQLLHKAGLSPSAFQAILALPFFHLGSELFSRSNTDVMSMACAFSYSLHLPMMDSYMARTSVSQAEALLQIESSPFIKKTIVNYLPNNKPILLIINKHDTLSRSEQYLIHSAHCFYQNKDLSLNILPISAFQDSIKVISDKFFNRDTNLISYGKYSTTISTKGVILNELTKTTNAAFLSSGDSSFENSIHAYNGKLTADSLNEKFELSIWQKIFTSKSSLPVIEFCQYDNLGKLLNKKVYYANESSDDFYNGWIRASFQFKNYTPSDSVSVKVWDTKGLEIANLLIRPANVNVYTNFNQGDSTFTFNNYFIGK